MLNSSFNIDFLTIAFCFLFRGKLWELFVHLFNSGLSYILVTFEHEMWFRNHNLVTQERNVMPADCQISNQKLKISYQLFNRESA